MPYSVKKNEHQYIFSINTEDFYAFYSRLIPPLQKLNKISAGFLRRIKKHLVISSANMF